MENSITYLLGAGASANAVPVQAKLLETLSDLQRDISSLTFIPDDTFNIPNLPNKIGMRDKFFGDLIWLYGIIDEYGTPDTYAERLTKNSTAEKEAELRRLKIIYSAFLVLAQGIKKTDTRYHNFLNRITDSGLNFKENVKILSWNYDYQLERAFSPNSSNDSLLVVQKRLGTYHGNFMPVPIVNVNKRNNIYKLNGTATLHDFVSQKRYDLATNFRSNVKNNSVLENIIRDYGLVLNDTNFLPQLSFAWENNSNIESALRSSEATKKLIVIGYSFPETNRGIDRQLISNMKSLQEIHVQDPYNGDLIASKVQEFYSDRKITVRKDKDTFFIPEELI